MAEDRDDGKGSGVIIFALIGGIGLVAALTFAVSSRATPKPVPPTIKTHMACIAGDTKNYCSPVSGEGPDQCTVGSDCTDAKSNHNICLIGGMCYRTNTGGIDECQWPGNPCGPTNLPTSKPGVRR